MLSEPGLTYPVVYGESQKTESEMYSDILPSTVVRSEDVHYPDSEWYLPSHTHSTCISYDASSHRQNFLDNQKLTNTSAACELLLDGIHFCMDKTIH